MRGSLVDCSWLLGVAPDWSCRLGWLSLGTCADIGDEQNASDIFKRKRSLYSLKSCFSCSKFGAAIDVIQSRYQSGLWSALLDVVQIMCANFFKSQDKAAVYLLAEHEAYTLESPQTELCCCTAQNECCNNTRHTQAQNVAARVTQHREQGRCTQALRLPTPVTPQAHICNNVHSVHRSLDLGSLVIEQVISYSSWSSAVS